MMTEERRVFDDLDEALEAMGQEPIGIDRCPCCDYLHGYTEQGRPYMKDPDYDGAAYKNTITFVDGYTLGEYDGPYMMYEEDGKYVVEPHV